MSIMTSIPYITVLIFLFITAFLEKNLKGRQLWFVRITVLVILILFLGLRGFIGTDFTNYYGLFKNIDDEAGSITDFNFEIGFLWLTYFLKWIWNNYHFYIFSLTLIHLIPLSFFFVRRTRNLSLAFIFFLGFRGLIFEFNLLQNTLSILFFILSFPYLEKKRYFRFILLNLIGASFHLSSLLFISLIFFLNKRFKLKVHITLLFIGNCIYFLKPDLIIEGVLGLIESGSGINIGQYLSYFYNDVSAKLTFGYLERIITISIILVNKKAIEQKLLGANIFINMATIYNIVMLLFSSVYVLYDRLSLLFIISYWFLIPHIILNDLIKKRIYIAILMLFICFIKLTISTQDSVMRYNNLIFKIESYNERYSEVQKHNYYFNKR